MFKGFTGIDQAYESPERADLVVRTVGKSIQDSVMEVIEMLEKYVRTFAKNFLKQTR